ncbi:MAG: HAMP domain-containing protein [Anaerolineae bacterium]|nr:HAMP domain-containing protein [Anaerolineae bacterium]
MIIDELRSPGPFSLEVPLWLPSLVLLAAYLAAFAWIFWKRRDDFHKLDRKGWAIFLVLLIAVVPLHRLLAVYPAQRVVIPPGPMNVLPFTSAISLPAFAVIAAVAYVFGPGPGLVAGLIGGLAWARYTPLIVTDVLSLATWGCLVGVFLHQRYRGDIFRGLRQPLVALTLASVITVLLLSLSRLTASRIAGGLHIIDFVIVLWRNELPLWVFVGAGIGLLYQLIALNPKWRLPQQGEVTSFYSRSLSAQFMVLSVPIVLISVLFSVLAVTNRSVTLAQEQSLEEMKRSAVTAAKNIQQFYLTGRNLIDTFSEEPQLLSDDPRLQRQTLNIALRVVPFFQQLLLVQWEAGEFEIVEATPVSAGDVTLTTEELAALEALRDIGMGVEETRVMDLQLTPVLVANGYSVVGTVDPEDLGRDTGYYLVGRALFDVHPEIQAALQALQKTSEGANGAPTYDYTGFIVDESNWVVAHPDATQIRTVRTIEEAAQAQRETSDQGLVLETLTAEGEHILAYIHHLDTIPLRVVLELPYITVLETAQKTAGSLLIVQIVFGLLLTAVIPILSSRITRPLNSLALAANRIAQGNLQGKVEIAGDDEVAQLGDSFEQMRIRLQERLNELSLLLGVAQKVSATLDLERGIVPILEGALVEVSGSIARFIHLREESKQPKIYSVGSVEGDVSALDRALTVALLRRQDPLIIPDLKRAQQSVNVDPSLASAAAFPVRHHDKTVAVLWVGAGRPNVFDEARVNFLATLANQAAVLIENARLFQTAEGGRRRLHTILSSTRDAILVVDAEGRLQMSNPAAERLFGIDGGAMGTPISELEMPEPLTAALVTQTTTLRRMRRYQIALPKSLRPTLDVADDDEPLPSIEVPFEDGRTFYASVAPYKSNEGLTLGVVVVLRDVTHFKELDELKSEFVATVSHDLRAPLTFMRGYTTMLSMVGDLNDRQRDYMQRILEGIEQMNGLVGDLLDLRRVEAGVGIRQEPCRLGLILVEAVEAMRTRASAKGVELRLEPAEGSPTVVGDRTLLRQSVSNLVDNAVKYTPSGGEVTVGLDITEDTATIRVSDTGIGIAPADQVRLFEKFYRIKRRETGNIQGTGLGLALVKSIVERHGGRVWVDSALNRGSTFYIQLPLPPEDSADDRI